MSKMIVFGDEHVRQEQPFFNAKEDYFNWVLDQPWNNEENSMLQVGDLFHRNIPTPLEVGLVVDFLVRCKFKQIIIMAGNGSHEFNRAKGSYAIDCLNSMPRVTTVYKPTELKIKEILILLLPWIPDHHYDDIETMKKLYENLPKSFKEHAYDYIFGHFACKTFFDSEINIDYLTGKRRMGHIHIPDETYIGVNTITRSDEKGLECNLNCIELVTGEEELIPIPSFIDYYIVKYSEDIPEDHVKYPILEIYDAPSDEEAEERYSEYHIHSIKLLNNKQLGTGSNSESTSLSLIDHMNNFILDRDIEKSVAIILRDKIREIE